MHTTKRNTRASRLRNSIVISPESTRSSRSSSLSTLPNVNLLNYDTSGSTLSTDQSTDTPPPTKRPRNQSPTQPKRRGRPPKNPAAAKPPLSTSFPLKREESATRRTPDPSMSRKAEPIVSVPVSRTASSSGYKPTGRPRGRPPKNKIVVALGEGPPPQSVNVARPQEEQLNGAVHPNPPEPSIPPLMRAGMGDNQPDPPESYIRTEGLRLIKLANSYRAEANGRYGPRDPSPESEPPLSRMPSPPAGRAISLDPSSVGDRSRVHIRANGIRARQNTSRLSAQPMARNSTHSLSPPPAVNPQPRPDIFEQEWAQVSELYERTGEEYKRRYIEAAMQAAEPQRQVVRRWNDPGESRIPVFHPGQPATVLLDGTVESAPRPQDRLERYELEGLGTLPEPFKREAEKFADHVKVSAVIV